MSPCASDVPELITVGADPGAAGIADAVAAAQRLVDRVAVLVGDPHQQGLVDVEEQPH